MSARQPEQRNKASSWGLLVSFAKPLMYMVFKKMLRQKGVWSYMWTSSFVLQAHGVKPNGGRGTGRGGVVVLVGWWVAGARQCLLGCGCLQKTKRMRSQGEWREAKSKGRLSGISPQNTFCPFSSEIFAGNGQLQWIHNFKMQLEN